MERFQLLCEFQERLEFAELFLMNIEVERHFSFGTWHSRQHLFLKLGSGEMVGWGEEIADLNNPDCSLEEWTAPLRQLKGMTIGAALTFTRSAAVSWNYRLREMIEMALIDLAGKLSGRSALELLGLRGAAAVPGLFCILDNDRKLVMEKAQQAWNNGFRSHLKLKLFGDVELDGQLVSATREVYGEKAYVVGDANTGYRPQHRSGGVDEVGQAMLELWNYGLSACEDPAELDIAQWEALQLRVDPLELIPDVPLRPASVALNTVTPHMGKVFNIHPGAMGSILDAVLLAEKIQAFGGKLMIGDNSLVGPACTVWQQFAIGVNASWVEALEKEDEFPAFAKLAVKRATSVGTDGMVSLLNDVAGFGLELDEELLRSCSKKRVLVS